jgi:hypothetical protein
MASEYSMLLSLIHNAFKPLHNPPANAAIASRVGQQADFYFEFFKNSLLRHHNYVDLMVELEREHRGGVIVRCRNFHAMLEFLKTPTGLSYIPVSVLSESNIQKFIEGDFKSDFILKGVNLGITDVKINYTGDEPTIKVTLTEDQEQILFSNIWNDLL